MNKISINNRYTGSIRYKLLIPILLAMVVVFMLIYVVINDVTQKNSIERVKELSMSQAKNIAFETDAFFNEARNTTYTLSKSFLAQRNFGYQSRQLILDILHQSLFEKKNYYAIFTMWEKNAFDSLDMKYGQIYGQETGRFSASAYWIDDSIAYQNHNVIVSDEPAYLSDGSPDEFADDYYLLPKTTKSPLITEPYLYSYSKGTTDVVYMSSVVYPVLYNDVFLGVVGVDIDIMQLQEIIPKVNVAANMYYSIISAEGVIIVNADSLQIGKEAYSITSLTIKEIQDSLTKSEYIVSEYYSDYHKENMLQYFIPISMTGVNAPWLVMVEITKSRIYADSHKLSIIIAISSFISFMLLVTIIFYLSNSLIHPIESIAKFAKKLSGGDLNARIANIKRKDELGKLIDTLHSMAIQLDKHTNHLEELVLEKTHEIECVNEELRATNDEVLEKNNELQTTLTHLHHTQSQLLQSEKMASLGTLTAGVAHEINNPLNYIMGAYVGLDKYFKEIGSKNEQLTSLYLRSIKEGIDRSSNIVKGLNQFSRNNKNQNEDCDIHSIIDNCLAILHNHLKHKAEVIKKYYTMPLISKGNTGELHQVFTNILSNANHAIKDKGVITIETKKYNENIEIVISDNGCGIEEGDLKKVTDPFFTTKPPGEGTGLGLSISYSIIKAHNGTIKYESEINKGTDVILTLPFKKENNE